MERVSPDRPAPTLHQNPWHVCHENHSPYAALLSAINPVGGNSFLPDAHLDETLFLCSDGALALTDQRILMRRFINRGAQGVDRVLLAPPRPAMAQRESSHGVIRRPVGVEGFRKN